MLHQDDAPDFGAPMAARPAGSAVAVIEDWLAPIEGRALLDVGCGRGALAKRLAGRGARVCGVDPAAEAVREARRAAPEADFIKASGECLPFTDASFDAVLLVNSFHHVPPAVMAAALDEAGRVSRGPVLVIEPLAEGPFFEAMRPVEDETAVRRAAQEVIARRVAEGRFVLARSHEFDDVRRLSGVDALLARIVEADSSRAEAAARLRADLETLMARWGTPEAEGVRLDQPHRAVLLAPPGQP